MSKNIPFFVPSMKPECYVTKLMFTIQNFSIELRSSFLIRLYVAKIFQHIFYGRIILLKDP